MPFSDSVFNDTIAKFLEENKYQQYLDVGPGAGKYGVMIRKVNPQAHIIAVEAEKSYIPTFKLDQIYNQIISVRIEDFVAANPGFTTDVAIIGDCLEHLPKSAGVDLIHYLVYRSRYMILVFPSKYIQYDWKRFVTESHNSVWAESDFGLFDYTYEKKGFTNLVVIKGYIGDPEARSSVEG